MTFHIRFCYHFFSFSFFNFCSFVVSYIAPNMWYVLLWTNVYCCIQAIEANLYYCSLGFYRSFFRFRLLFFAAPRHFRRKSSTKHTHTVEIYQTKKYTRFDTLIARMAHTVWERERLILCMTVCLHKPDWNV